MNSLRLDDPIESAPGAVGEASWISKTPGVCGGQACIRHTRITVWGLETLRRFGLPDHQIIQEIEGLTRADLAAAREYVAAHPDEIEAAIRLNDEEA